MSNTAHGQPCTELVKGDTKPVLQMTCEIGDPRIIDLTGCQVFFIFRKAGLTIPKFRRACIVLSPATAGVVEFHWIAHDLDVIGDYMGELEIIYPDLTIQTSNLMHFKVRDNLGR